MRSFNVTFPAGRTFLALFMTSCMLDWFDAGSRGLKETRGRRAGVEVVSLPGFGAVDEEDIWARCTLGVGEGNEKKAG